VLFSLFDRFRGDRYKRALEESVVHYILLAIFAFNDPVSNTNLTLSEIGNDPGIVGTLPRLYQEWSACAKRIHGLAPSVHNTDKNHFNIQLMKMA
jgi:hypothetical protein